MIFAIYFGILNVQGCHFFLFTIFTEVELLILNFFKRKIRSLQKQKSAVSLGP